MHIINLKNIRIATQKQIELEKNQAHLIALYNENKIGTKLSIR